jgi:hypothetical protein
MACIEGVVGAFFPFGKTRKPAFFAQAVESRVTPGQEFMGVALVPHIPYDLVFRRIENAVKCDAQFYGAEVGGKMPSVPGNSVYNRCPNLGGKPVEIPGFENFYIRRAVYPR